MIRADGITKRFSNRVIFNNLDFYVRKGQIKAIVGPSGRGKTTLLNVLSGLDKVQGGTITIDKKVLVEDGRYIKTKEQNEVLKSVGIVFQNFNLFSNLNVYKNLEVVKNDKEKADKLLKRFGLYDKKDLFVGSLSGGEKQRLSIIRALMIDPKIIFFDEPTSALDIKNIEEVIKLILELKRDGLTIVVVTHDSKFVELLGCEIFNF